MVQPAGHTTGERLCHGTQGRPERGYVTGNRSSSNFCPQRWRKHRNPFIFTSDMTLAGPCTIWIDYYCSLTPSTRRYDLWAQGSHRRAWVVSSCSKIIPPPSSREFKTKHTFILNCLPKQFNQLNSILRIHQLFSLSSTSQFIRLNTTDWDIQIMKNVFIFFFIIFLNTFRINTNILLYIFFLFNT